MAGCVQLQARDTPRLLQRLLLAVALMGSEALMASMLLDGDALYQKPGFLPGVIREWGAWCLRLGLGFSALFPTFARLKYKVELISLSGSAGRAPFSRIAIAVDLL